MAILAAGLALAAPAAADAASFSVNSLADEGDGICDATCTLRDALAAANAAADPDAISFTSGLTGQITLAGGQLPIQAGVTISGPGAGQLAISGDANANGVPDADDSRIFAVDTDVAGNPGEAVTISGLTLRGGNPAGGGGGAINSTRSNLTIADSSIVDGSSPDRGGAIYTDGGSLTVVGSTLQGNLADRGGAIYTDDTAGEGVPNALTITQTTITGNRAGNNGGGGVYIGRGTENAVVAATTISRNKAATGGGGITLDGPSASFTMTNSTIAGNASKADGGGISALNQLDAPIALLNSTIANNSAAASGGGIYRQGTDDPALPGDDSISLASTIVADNSAPSGPDLADAPVASGSFRSGYSLIENAGAAAISQSPAGSTILDVDPKLASLGPHGGPTWTQPPAARSRAVDAGVANGLPVDQRGFARRSNVRSAQGVEGSDETDIGAVELRAPQATIDSGPSGRIEGNSATFTFSTDTPEATLRCQIDGGQLAACSSPVVLRNLSEGVHTFSVRASTEDGATGEFAHRRIVVDTGLLSASIKAKGTQHLRRGRIKVAAHASAGEDVVVTAKGSIKIGGGSTLPLNRVKASLTANHGRTLSLTPRPLRSRMPILRALRSHKRVIAKVSVTITDHGEHDLQRSFRVRLKR